MRHINNMRDKLMIPKVCVICNKGILHCDEVGYYVEDVFICKKCNKQWKNLK